MSRPRRRLVGASRPARVGLAVGVAATGLLGVYLAWSAVRAETTITT